MTEQQARDLPYKLYQVTDKENIDKMSRMGTVAFENYRLSEKNLISICAIARLNDAQPLRPDGKYELFVITGQTMNNCYHLTGDNAYDDEVKIICLPANNITNSIMLSFELAKVGGRLLSVILKRNARHEQEQLNNL